MAEVKAIVFSVVALLSILIRPGIRAQPTTDSSSEDDSCSQLEEGYESQAVVNLQLRSELESERQRIKTLENVSYRQAEEIQRLYFEVKDERRRQRSQESPPVTATLISRFDHKQYRYGITKVEDKIYVLDNNPNRIQVYEDLIGFRFLRYIALSGTAWPQDIVYSNASKCVYISDQRENCIWVMTTTGEHRLTKWLSNTNWPYTLSLSNEGHLLVLRHHQSSQLDINSTNATEALNRDSLEIYSLNANLNRRLHLPQDINHPRHVVQTSTGNFIILHQLNNASTWQWVISQLTNDGHLIHRFIPRNQSQELNEPAYLSLDSDNNRLFVADYYNYRVILFDSSCLTWSQVLLSQEMNGIRNPFRLFYDASKKHLFVSEYYSNGTVYEIN